MNFKDAYKLADENMYQDKERKKFNYDILSR